MKKIERETIEKASQSPTGSATTDLMLTKVELAKRLKLTRRTVENWQRRGVLPFLKVGKIVLFYWPDVVEHLKTNFRVCPKEITK